MRASRPLLRTAALATAVALAGCGGMKLPGGGTPDPVTLAKLDGLWSGTGSAAGLTVRIARAGSSQPAMMYGFRDEAPTRPQCSQQPPATLVCKHESGLTTTYTLAADSGVDFTAKGPKDSDELLKAKLARAAQP